MSDQTEARLIRPTMTILYLIECSEQGGAETVVLSLARKFKDMKHASVVGLLEPGWLPEQLKEEGFQTIMLEQKRAYDLACVWNLCKIIRTFKIEIIHAHEFMMNTYGTLAGLLTGTPVIATVHGKNYYCLKRRRRMAYWLVSILSTMVAVSEDLRNFVADVVGIPQRRIRTIYNGVDFEKYARGLRHQDMGTIRKSLSIEAQSQVVGTVGMLAPVKDHITLLKAAKKIVRARPDVIFLIVGGGPLEGVLRAEVDKLGIEKNVRLTGFRNDVGSLLQVMDIYVCSSRSEGHSLSILEAMVAGRPVIATNVGGNPEVVVDYETGFLVPPDDHERLASKILLLLNDRALADRLGVKGQQRVREKFSLERMVSSYHELYESVLRKNERQAKMVPN